MKGVCMFCLKEVGVHVCEARDKYFQEWRVLWPQPFSTGLKKGVLIRAKTFKPSNKEV